jgi:hypothetical protein
MLKQVENLVLGSGFVALQAYKSLNDAGRVVMVVDASNAIRIDDIRSENPEYLPANLNRTAQPGGVLGFGEEK